MVASAALEAGVVAPAGLEPTPGAEELTGAAAAAAGAAAAAAAAMAAAAVAAAAAAPVPFGSVRQKLVRKTTSAAKLCFGVTISGESYCAENLPALIAAFAAMDPPIKVEGISSKEFNELAHGIDSRRSRSGGAREVAAMVTPEAAAAAVPAAHPGHPGDFSDI